MKQLSDYADDRLINDCIFCGAYCDTRDHVPSKIFLDSPYPENLTVVGACDSCNNSFSKDEQYLVCLLECILAGSTEPDNITRPSVSRALKRAPALKAKIESMKKIVDGYITFNYEENRVRNVMLKLARGHAAYELSQPCKVEPDYYWCGPIESLTNESLEQFDSAYVVHSLGELGSRNMQRLFFCTIQRTKEDGEVIEETVLVNDWIEVQENRYRYIAIDDNQGVIIRIVISEYLACEVRWENNI